MPDNCRDYMYYELKLYFFFTKDYYQLVETMCNQVTIIK